eukprot:scaffold2261_cov405-Prasinococcus_capsulatus_cf.AAC.3
MCTQQTPRRCRVRVYARSWAAKALSEFVHALLTRAPEARSSSELQLVVASSTLFVCWCLRAGARHQSVGTPRTPETELARHARINPSQLPAPSGGPHRNYVARVSSIIAKARRGGSEDIPTGQKPKAPNVEVEQQEFLAPFGLTWYDIALIGGGITLLVAALRCVLFCCEFRQAWVAEARANAMGITTVSPSHRNFNRLTTSRSARYEHGASVPPNSVFYVSTGAVAHREPSASHPFATRDDVPGAYRGRDHGSGEHPSIIEASSRRGHDDVETLRQIEMARRESFRTLAQDREHRHQVEQAVVASAVEMSRINSDPYQAHNYERSVGTQFEDTGEHRAGSSRRSQHDVHHAAHSTHVLPSAPQLDQYGEASAEDSHGLPSVAYTSTSFTSGLEAANVIEENAIAGSPRDEDEWTSERIATLRSKIAQSRARR